ncbi:MAG: CARDB domain-containing protein, partial [Candidatus Nanoarchaeia archaeon]
DIELKEDKIVNIGRLRSNGGLKNIVYNFHTAHNAVDGNRNIELKLSWRGSNSEAIQSKEYSFSVLIRGDEPELTISKIKSSPEKIMEKEDVILTYDIENYGEATAKNVRIFLEGLKFQGTKEAYLGEIEPHESLPARFILVAGKNGEQNYNLKIMYETHGLEKEKDFPLKITVFNKSQLSYWIGGIILFSAFVLYYIYLRKPKKRK